MYSRSQEYSADRVAQVLTEDVGIRCMAMLTVGRHLYPYVDVDDYLQNIYKKPNVLERIARWIVNLMTDHPINPLRVRAIVDPEKKSGRLI
jgi:Zn-dependent protease with chaperone function